jgi:hypothetical protein
VDLESDASVDGEEKDIAASERVHEPEPTGTHSSAPGTRSSGSFEIGECLEGKGLTLMLARNTAWSSEFIYKENNESQRLAFEIKCEVRHFKLEKAKVEVEIKRAKTDKEREARLQRREEREDRHE